MHRITMTHFHWTTLPALGFCLLLPLLTGCDKDVSNDKQKKKEIAAENKKQSQIIKTNMFDLGYEKLLHIKTGKWGGGIGETDRELIIVTGDGQTRVVDLKTMITSEPVLGLPLNNEKEAIIEAGRFFSIEEAEQAERAPKSVTDWFRYDDILVYSAESRLNILLSYSHFDTEKRCFTHRVSLLQTPENKRLVNITASPDDWSTVFVSRPCFRFRHVRYPYAGHQSGGRIDVVDPAKGEIILALGDYEFDGFQVPNYPQDLDTDYGKTIKINIFSHEKEVLSIGHRNPQGITVDTNGGIWAVEHGPQGGDELNRVEQGKNYGWPNVLHGIRYGNKPWPLARLQGRHDGYDYPAFSWVPSIAPSNIDQSIGFHPYWEEDLLVFTLRSQSIHRLRVDGDRVLFDEPIEFKERIRYGLNHAQSGNIFIFTDNGNLYRIFPEENAWTLVERSRLEYDDFLKSQGGIQSLQDAALTRCLECHTGAAGAPPELKGIIGEDIAGTGFTGYSTSLLNKEGRWNEESLRAFLQDPQGFAPGTTMPDPGVGTEKTLDVILEALQQLGD